MTPPAPGTIQSASFDQNGDFVVGTNDDRVWRLANPAIVPATGIAPVVIGKFSFPLSQTIQDLSVVGATSEPFQLVLEPVPVLAARLELANPPGPIGLGFVFMSTSTYLPQGTGPFFGLMPDALTLAILDLPPPPAACSSSPEPRRRPSSRRSSRWPRSSDRRGTPSRSSSPRAAPSSAGATSYA